MKTKELLTVEKEIVKYFLSGKNISIDDQKSFLSDVFVRERDFTGVGFFTYFEKSEKLKVGNDAETYTFSKLGAKINQTLETGYLLYVKRGYIESLEGFTYGEPWPKNIDRIEPYSI